MINGQPQVGQRPYPPGPPQDGGEGEGRYPGPSPQGQRAYPSGPPQTGQRAYLAGPPQAQGRGPYPGPPGRGRGGPFAGRYPSGPPVPGRLDDGEDYNGGPERQGESSSSPSPVQGRRISEYEEEEIEVVMDEEESSIDGIRNSSSSNNNNNNNNQLSMMFDDEMEEEILDEEILEEEVMDDEIIDDEIIDDEIIDEEESTFIKKGDAESKSSDGFFSNTAVSFRLNDELEEKKDDDDIIDDDEIKDPYAGTIFGAGEDSVTKAEEDLLLEIDELEEMEVMEDQKKLNDDIDDIMNGIEDDNDGKRSFAESYNAIDVVEREEEDPSYISDEEVSSIDSTMNDPENPSADDEVNNDPVTHELYYNKDPSNKKNNGFMLAIGCCGILIVLAGVAFLILFFTDLWPFERSIESPALDNRSTPVPAPTNAPTNTPILNQTPNSVPMDRMDDGDCNFDGLNFPDIRAQCRCSDSVLIIPTSVKEEYSTLNPQIMGDLGEGGWNYQIDDCDAENLALLFLASGDGGIVSLSIGLKIQRFVLAQFFYQLDGPSWRSNENWLSSDNECMWLGVTCDRNELVTELNLDANIATGKIPSNVAQLTKLRILSLAENNISDVIPKGLFDLTDLETLNLGGNFLNGELPNNIGNAKSLKNLILSDNILRGTIPETIVGKGNVMFETIALNNNILEGSIPTQIGVATSLRKLDLAANSISDNLPKQMYQLTRLEYLNLEKNNAITGRIPTEFGTFKNLEFLSLSETKIRSRFPVEYTNLSKLTTLRISNTLVGAEIPTQITSMTSLLELDLSKSRFRQRLPKELGDLKQLTSLKLNDNQMEGEIVTQLGLLTSLEYLWLDGNMFKGAVPPELGDLTNLKELILSSNNFSSRVPQDVCNLRTEGSLNVFSTDCPNRNAGVVCGIPSCCTSCSRSL